MVVSTPSPEALGQCPACGLGLPSYARFCARCGTPQPHPTGRAPVRTPAYAGWLLILFWVGTALALLIAVVYTSIAVSPGIAQAPGLDQSQVRLSALVVAVLAAGLFAVQLIASVGLTQGRAWARTPATIASVGWALTCLGLPVAVFALMALWRGRNAERAR